MSGNEDDYLKRVSVDFVIEQLKMREEDAVKAGRLDRYDVLIKDKDIKIKVKFSKPRQRSRCISPKWEFAKIIHSSRLWPIGIYDFYILVGFGKNGNIEKFWKISADDGVIYRKNQIFIPICDTDDYEAYKRYELSIIEELSPGEFKWVD